MPEVGVPSHTLQRVTPMRSPLPQSCQTAWPPAAPRPPRRWSRWRHRLGLAPPTARPAASPGPAAPEGAWAHLVRLVRLVRLVPDDIDATAHATGALQRRRAVGSAAALLWLVLAYAVAGWSLRLVAAVAAPRGIEGLGDLS